MTVWDFCVPGCKCIQRKRGNFDLEKVCFIHTIHQLLVYFVSCHDRFKFLFLPYSDSRANLKKYVGVSSDSDVFAAIIAKKYSSDPKNKQPY